MTTNILMPALSPTMEKGNIVKWHVKTGDRVLPGDLLAEIETDKATMELECIDEGIITEITVKAGTENVSVNEIIAKIKIDEDLTDISNNKEHDAATVNEPSREKVNTNHNKTLTESSDRNNIKGAHQPDTRIKISPLARKLAEANNIDFNEIRGTGPYGRIVKSDIEKISNELLPHTNTQKETTTKKSNTNDLSTSDLKRSQLTDIEKIFINRDYETIQLTSIRKSIASKLVESKQSVPHFYLRRTVNVDKLLSIRSELNQELATQDVKLSINDFIIKAAAKALQDNKSCNSVWAGDRILRFKQADIAVAVAIDDGLITPVLKNANVKSLTDISKEMKNLAGKARTKKLLPEEYIGGSFSISNLGMMGVESFDAIINPPQASILAVGATCKKPLISQSGEVYIANVMSLSLSADHRVIDGATGAVFLGAIADNLANPFKLLL